MKRLLNATSLSPPLQAGGCFVPLDPEYPDDRLAGYMEDSKAAVLVTRSGHADRAAQLGGEAAVWKVRAIAVACVCVLLARGASRLKQQCPS
jgi:non-ribosomal peptide synthetase component F